MTAIVQPIRNQQCAQILDILQFMGIPDDAQTAQDLMAVSLSLFIANGVSKTDVFPMAEDTFDVLLKTYEVM